MFKLNLEKVEEPEIKLPTSVGSQKKQEVPEKIYCFIDYAEAFDCVDHNNVWKILKDTGVRSSQLHPVKPVCRSRSKS